MSLYGIRWEIDGVKAASISRGESNGQYRILFEREFAELSQIEAINWDRPIIKHLIDTEEFGLPEGYGFNVEKITYDSNTRSYDVFVSTATQYLGDVTGYQDQIRQMNTEIAEKDTKINTQAQEISEQKATIDAQAQEISEQKATIDAQAQEISEQKSQIENQAQTISMQETRINTQAQEISAQKTQIETQAQTISLQKASLETINKI